MGRIIADGLSEKGKQQTDQNASEVPYNNTGSGLTATDTQAAIDEVESRVGTMADRDLFVSESEPTAQDGEDGDVWFVLESV